MAPPPPRAARGCWLPRAMMRQGRPSRISRSHGSQAFSTRWHRQHIFLQRAADSALATDIRHKSDCLTVGLLQCPASTGTASAVSGQLHHASVAPRQSSVVPHFAWLVAICPRLASPPASMPFPAAWHDSYQEKPRVATARIAGMAVRGRTEKAAARLVYSAASEERERRGHCGYGSYLHAGGL